MTVDEQRGLGLLIALSSGCLGLPRYTDDDGGGDDAGDGPGTTTEVSNDDGPGPEGPEGPEGPMTTSVDDDAESFLFQPDLGGTTVGDESDVTTDPTPSPGCQAYSALAEECYGRDAAESAYGYCIDYLSYLELEAPECIPMFEEFLVCISALSCREFQDGTGCEIELEKLFECRGV